MNKIEVRGVIVPSSFDDDFLKDYIEKGQIIPESKFRRELAEAPTDEKLVVYLNTPGGSVFAGNEMINAVKDWALENGQPVEVRVGAMAASMGAAMVMTIPGTIKAHANSKIMFHSAISCMCGGAGAMQDEADLIEKINADTKAALLEKSSISPEMIETWFSEGREGWISAQEALEAGIIDEIIGEQSEALTLSETAATALTDRGMRVAALKMEVEEEEKEDEEIEKDSEEDQNPDKSEDESADSDSEDIEDSEESDESAQDEPETKDEEEPPAEESDESKDNEGTEDGDKDETTEEEETDGEAAAADSNDETPPEVAQLSDKLLEATASAKDWQSKYDSLKARVEADAAVFEETIQELKTRIEKAESEKLELSQRLSKLTLQAVKLPKETPQGMTWAAALKQCNGDFAEAKKQFPQVHERFFQETQTGGPFNG